MQTLTLARAARYYVAYHNSTKPHSAKRLATMQQARGMLIAAGWL